MLKYFLASFILASISDRAALRTGLEPVLPQIVQQGEEDCIEDEKQRELFQLEPVDESEIVT